MAWIIMERINLTGFTDLTTVYTHFSMYKKCTNILVKLVKLVLK